MRFAFADWFQRHPAATHSDEYGTPALARGPLIHQVQQQQHIPEDDEGSYITPSPTRLSTISERTEVPEGSLDRRYSPGQGFTNYRSMHLREDSSSTMSYGNLIHHYDARADEEPESETLGEDVVDPNTIAPSPPQSALVLAQDEEPDDASDRTASPPPHAFAPQPRSASTPHLPQQLEDTRERPEHFASAHARAIPVDVFRQRDTPTPEHEQVSDPSPTSSSSRLSSRRLRPPVNKPLPALPPPSEPRLSAVESLAPSERQPTSERPITARKSKLSQLASTRMSTVTRSSRLSLGTTGTSSILTFPALRPSAESEYEISGNAERLQERQEEEARWRAREELREEDEEKLAEEGELQTLAVPTAVRDSAQTDSTTMSTIVRRAIESAMALEAVDREIPPTPHASPSKDTQVSSPIPRLEVISATSSRGRTPSSAESVDVFASAAAARKAELAPKPPAKATPTDTVAAVAHPPASAVSSSERKGPSKLSLLAQASKEKQKRATLLHKTHTEYLTPTANGPTATTAITTSYQTLDSLQPLDSLPPSFPPPGYTPPAISKSRSTRESKTPRESKTQSATEGKTSKLAAKARAKKASALEDATAEEVQKWLPEPTPVIFSPEAALAWKTQERERRKTKERRKSEDAGTARRKGDDRKKGEEGRKKERSRSRTKEKKVHVPRAPLGPFAFDTLSPDDIVFSARKGTSLGVPASGASTPSVMPASTPASRASLASTASAATYHTANASIRRA